MNQPYPLMVSTELLLPVLVVILIVGGFVFWEALVTGAFLLGLVTVGVAALARTWVPAVRAKDRAVRIIILDKLGADFMRFGYGSI
jgi:hypothetical protein